MGNKLLCTFVKKEEISSKVEELAREYKITFDRIFVLHVYVIEEFALTYGIDVDHAGKMPENTITVHRKKETNTLYTINALNQLIGTLNNGVLDKSYPVTWQNYTNKLMITRGDELKILPTKLYHIVDLKVDNG